MRHTHSLVQLREQGRLVKTAANRPPNKNFETHNNLSIIPSRRPCHENTTPICFHRPFCKRDGRSAHEPGEAENLLCSLRLF